MKERFNRGLYDCVFLTEVEGENGEKRRVCGVYPVRPRQCRTWPFWKENLDSDSSWIRASERCPGIGKGKKFTVAEIESIRD